MKITVEPHKKTREERLFEILMFIKDKIPTDSTADDISRYIEIALREEELMKIEIHEQEKQEEIKFPCLMVFIYPASIYEGQIFLMINGDDNSYNGFNLHGGWHSTNWIKSDFKPFKGKVTLSND